MTINVAKNAGDGDTDSVVIASGQYAFAVADVPSGASIEARLNVGQKDSVVFKTFTQSEYNIFWMPDCSLHFRATGTNGDTYNAAVVFIDDEDIE